MAASVVCHLLLSPIFISTFTATSHLLILLLLPLYWLSNKPHYHINNTKSSFFSSFLLSLFHLLLCVVYCFSHDGSSWTSESIATQLDLALTTLTWSSISAYMYYSTPLKFPLFSRFWWLFFCFMSCYCLVSAINPHLLLTHILIKGVGSILIGVFFLYLGVVGINEQNKNYLQQPLLNKGVGSEHVSPYSTAGILSVLTFSWLNPLLEVGCKKTLDPEDVPQLDQADSVSGFFPLFRSKVCSYVIKNDGQVSTFILVKAMVYITWGEIVFTGMLALAYTFASYVGPYLIDTFVQYLNGRREFKNEGYILVSVFFVAKLVECLSQRHWRFRAQRVGNRLVASLVAMIYEKGQTLSSQSKQVHTTGEIINYLTVDAERIAEFSSCMHNLWMVPIQVILALWILYKNLGLASVAAFVATVLVMLANLPLGKVQENFQQKLMESKDKRMRRTSEILRNMRILKLQGWEMKFLSKITDLRKNEEGWLKKYVYTVAITTFIFWGATTFVSVVTFGACMLMGIPLQSGKILSALATFRILQEPIYDLPDTISMVAQSKVSLDRIASFLRLNDLNLDEVETISKGSDLAIEIKDGNFSWNQSSSNPTLKDINFQVFRGMKVAVCGTVGSGKSSLLSCILGEVPKISGTVKSSGAKAFVAQSPWIQSGKIEANILFGKEMDRGHYERVLEACSLKEDLEILPSGDQTVIGERGINLSGGQKQRIQIARALYQDTDIYLFDDPFSAVDAHTGTHLFKECLQGHLGSKTVMYVTHQVEFLPLADLILVMKDGKITESGRYEDILKSGTDFMGLVAAHKEALSTLNSTGTELASENLTSIQENDCTANHKIVEHEKENNIQRDTNCAKPEQNAQLVQEEEREKGKVGFQVYWKFITMAYKGALVPLILVAQISCHVLQIGSDFWMAWAAPMTKNAKPPVEGITLIFVYFALAVGSSFCILVRFVLLGTAGYKTATILFNKMHVRIFRAPMSFFDATPSGRILNRASTDQRAVDLKIPNKLGAFAFSVIQLAGIIAVMSQISWKSIIVFIPVTGTGIWYQQYYISTSRELARLIGVCKAPLIQHFAESISGSTTIRSFNQESKFMDINLKLIDSYMQPRFYSAGAMEWLCFRLDMLSSFTFAFSLIYLISVPDGTIDPGLAGLAVTYGLNLNVQQAWVVYNLCILETKIISVERILQYIDIPSEAPLLVEACKPDSDWPSQGEIDIHDLQVRYAPHMPLVLRGLTCTIHGGMRTGIVGRTGSGKSTLIQTLFRLVEPAAGEILIDGVNISTIGLHDLRSRLSIIPQDPTMFEGTLRSNLDPLEEHTNEQIWEVLDKCQLGDEVRKKEGKLNSIVSENGENWSVGQRQLVCLGRVLLKRSQVLVLDEATASVDTATDNLMQQTLRQHFSDSTVITVAHRITSILDSDMVLLLDHGLIMEYDRPCKLLENKSSLFAKLVVEYTVRSGSGYDSLTGL